MKNKSKIYFSGVWLSALLAFVLVSFVHVSKLINDFSTELDTEMIKVEMLLDRQINSYIYGLQGAAGVIRSQDFKFLPKVFRDYSESRNHFKNFEGALGYGFIRAVPLRDLKKYQQQRDFSVHPSPVIADAMVIEIIEPIENNLAARGLNIAFESNRREAALQAAKTGLPTLTRPIELVQVGAKHIGFLFLNPVYRSSKAPSTAEERLSSIVGWSYAPIVLSQAIRSFDDILPKDFQVRIQPEGTVNSIVMGIDAKKDPLIRNDASASIKVGGIEWSVSLICSTQEIWKRIFSVIISYALALIAMGFVVLRFLKLFQKQKSVIDETQSWLDALLNSAQYMVIATDENGIIKTFSRSAELTLGYTSQDLVNKKTPEMLHDFIEVRTRAETLSKELKRKVEPGFEVFVAKAKLGEADTNEWTYYKRNGDKIPVRLCVTSITAPDGSIRGFLGIAEDISKIKEITQQLEEERAKALHTFKLSVLGEMAGGLAHEINTPLAVIQGKTTILLSKVKELGLHPEFEVEVNKINLMVQRIAKIIKSMRVYSRAESSDPLEEVSLKEAMDSSMDLCSERLNQDNIKVKINIDPNLIVLARPNELVQVFTNLINNSWYAVRAQEDRWISVMAISSNPKVFISITDSGCGIDFSTREKMMNPFFTTKPVGDGTGLGLSVCKGLIESFGGTLQYDAGSTNTRFVVTLPLSQEAAAAPTQP